jgi:hypothetical protein
VIDVRHQRVMLRLRIKRFLLWLLPARKVIIEPEPQPYHGAFRDGRQDPVNLGGWKDLPYE